MTPISTGGAAKRVKVIEASDLKANGGAYALEGRAPVRVYGVTDAETKAQGGAYAVEGNVAMPVYVVGTAEPVEGTVAPMPMIGVLGTLAAGNVATPVIVVGGVLGLVPPLAPTNLTAAPTGTNNLHVLLDWDAPADTDEYDIEYSTDGVSYAPLITVTAPTTTYTHTTPTLDAVRHYYRVRGVNAAGDGAWATATIAGLLLGLMSYWTLNEVSGSRADSVGGNTLSDINTVGSTVGKISNAAAMVAASSEYLTIAAPVNINFSGSFSAWGWMRATSLATLQHLFDRRNMPTDNGYAFVMQATTPRWFIGSSFINWGSALSTGVWYFVYCEYNATAQNIGLSINAGTMLTAAHLTAPVHTGALSIGSRGATDRFFNGAADEWGLAARRLSTAQIAALYNAGAGLTYPFA